MGMHSTNVIIFLVCNQLIALMKLHLSRSKQCYKKNCEKIQAVHKDYIFISHHPFLYCERDTLNSSIESIESSENSPFIPSGARAHF